MDLEHAIEALRLFSEYAEHGDIKEGGEMPLLALFGDGSGRIIELGGDCHDCERAISKIYTNFLNLADLIHWLKIQRH